MDLNSVNDDNLEVSRNNLKLLHDTRYTYLYVHCLQLQHVSGRIARILKSSNIR